MGEFISRERQSTEPPKRKTKPPDGNFENRFSFGAILLLAGVHRGEKQGSHILSYECPWPLLTSSLNTAKIGRIERGLVAMGFFFAVDVTWGVLESIK